MAETRPSLFARVLKRLDPRLTFGLLVSCLFLSLVALSNLFALYYAIMEQDLNASLLRLLAFLLYALPAAGILLLKRWARLLGILLCGVAVLLGVLAFVAISPAEGAFIILPHGALLICLLSRKTRHAFSTPAP